MIGPRVDQVILVGVSLHDVSDALLADDLGYDIVAQRRHGVSGVCQAAAAAQVHLRERPASLTKLGPSKWLMLRGLAAASGKLRPQLLIVRRSKCLL